MEDRQCDGSAGDANYALIGRNYAEYRQSDPAIAAIIATALGEAATVINVGAGSGSYEPVGKFVTPIEPSASMRSKRAPQLAIALDAVAENLPFPDDHFDAGMATFTVHQWSDLRAGLTEMRRVTTGPIVILTCDPLLVENFWLNDYAPEVLRTEALRYPRIDSICKVLGGTNKVVPVMIPWNCKDGFNEAYYGRPEWLLNEKARLSCSAWSFVSRELSANYVRHLARELHDGTWDRKYGQLRKQPEFNGSLRLLVSCR